MTYISPSPTVNTLATTLITSTSALLNGTVNPNCLPTDGWFEWGIDSTFSAFSIAGLHPVGSGTAAQALSTSVPLTSGTTYYFRVAASNAAGTQRGTIASFGYLVAPSVTSDVAASVTDNSAVLNGTVNPNGLDTNAWFEWGADPTLTTFSSTTEQAVGSGTAGGLVTATLSGLGNGATYYFRTAARNSNGTQKGAILAFRSKDIYDEFSTDTRGDYGIVRWGPGTAEFVYDNVGKRLQVLEGNAYGMEFSHGLPARSSGVFSLTFNPTWKYPPGGGIWVRLYQDLNNCYEVSNFDWNEPLNPREIGVVSIAPSQSAATRHIDRQVKPKCAEFAEK